MKTARRRWSREFEKEVDGIAFGPEGPVLVHCYDPPAEGMWIDDVIPGSLAALDRHGGDVVWTAPCEIGYGRGFGAGFGAQDEIVVLGPSSQGHRIVRMARDNGRLLAAESIEAFDVALVHADLCLCLNAARVSAISTRAMSEVWEYSREGERYHHIGRCGDRLLVVFSQAKTSRQGVLALDVRTGARIGTLLPARQPVIHGLATDRDEAAILTADLESALPPELASQLLIELSRQEDEQGLSAGGDTLSLLGLSARAEEGDAPAWFRVLSRDEVSTVPEYSITANSGKLYLVHGALLEVRDLLTGRGLGGWTMPGLDEQIAFLVSEGAGLLAEEQRVSVFELPA
jgi:hypothetical protein